MTEYQIQANTRRCSVSGRELKPGETYYSVLLQEGGGLVRRDYGAESWTGPVTGAFGFWTGRVPAEGASRRPPVDDEVLLECLQRLQNETEPGRVNFRYVLALLLLRRKKLRLLEAKMDNGAEILVLQTVSTRERMTVANPGLSDAEIEAVQGEVLDMLGW